MTFYAIAAVQNTAIIDARHACPCPRAGDQEDRGQTTMGISSQRPVMERSEQTSGAAALQPRSATRASQGVSGFLQANLRSAAGKGMTLLIVPGGLLCLWLSMRGIMHACLYLAQWRQSLRL